MTKFSLVRPSLPPRDDNVVRLPTPAKRRLAEMVLRLLDDDQAEPPSGPRETVRLAVIRERTELELVISRR